MNADPANLPSRSGVEPGELLPQALSETPAAAESRQGL